MITVYLFSGLIIISYILLIIYFLIGWAKVDPPIFINPGKTSVTIIIPFRNEENNLPTLIESINKQSYNKEQLSILFVNDHSSDQSCKIVQSGINDLVRCKLVTLPDNLHGKKAALRFGANISKSEILVFTDADCKMGENWINSIVSYYEETNSFFISAPVIIEPGKSWISKFQALEYLSLSGSGAASFGHQNPIMTSGANIAVRRDIYIEDFKKDFMKTPSGDDIFLLLNLKKKYHLKLGYLKSRDAIVRTIPTPDIKSFLYQRLRWVSKARYYKDRAIIITASLVFIINLWLSACFILGFFIQQFFIIWGIIILLKSIPDFIFLKRVSIFTGQERLLKVFALSQLVYFLYIVITAILGNLMSIKWKERKIKV